MEDMLIMSKKELERKTLLDAHKFGKLKLTEVALRVGLCYRQTKRLWSNYQKEGDPGLCHKNRGRRPRIAYHPAFRTKILDLYEQKYIGFGPTYASEKLLEDDGISICDETLRLWLRKEGLLPKTRKRKLYRKKRERKPNFGDLLQIDGSIHKWFHDKDEHFCLLNIVDDATGNTLARMHKGETLEVLMHALLSWIGKYGLPKAVYVDLKSVYVSPKSIRDCTKDNPNGFSRFQRICRQLGIEVIKAYSPQAKGRVERKHRVFQDRLVKDIKLYHLKDVDEVNTYLEDKFLNKINAKFASFNDEIKDSHRDPSPYGDLQQIFCWTYQGHVRNDWTIIFKGRYYQIKKESYELVKPGTKITVKKHLDGQMYLWFDDQMLNFEQLRAKPELPSRSKKYYQAKGIDPILRAKVARQNAAKSSWGKTNHLCFIQKKKIRKAS